MNETNQPDTQDDRKVTATYPVIGMHCAGCVSVVERALASLPGVDEVAVNYAASTATISYEPNRLGVNDLATEVESAGYRLIVPDSVEGQAGPVAVPDPAAIAAIVDEAQQAELVDYRRRFTISAILTLLVAGLSMAPMFGWSIPLSTQTRFIVIGLLATPVVWWAGWPFHRGMWAALTHFRADMNTLISTGTLVAYLFSVAVTLWPEALTPAGRMPAVYYETAAMIVTLILAGRWMEAHAKGQARNAIRSLFELRPPTARVRRDGKLTEIAADDLVRGDEVVLRPGERVAADGVVMLGSSAIDESMLTGESLPVARGIGDSVRAGTVNTKGSVTYRVERTGADTTLSQIGRLVADAQASKPPIQKYVDRIAGIFVPVVLGIALLTFVIWGFWGPEPAWLLAMINSVAVLIVACPCALGLATPTAIMVGTGRGAQLGLLFRNASALEALAKIDTIILDKTGTLTAGTPTVTGEWLADSHNAMPVWSVVAAMEERSEHPLAAAILKRAEQQPDLESAPVESFSAEAGRGIAATVTGENWKIGNAAWFKTLGIDLSPVVSKVAAWENAGLAIALVACEQRLVAAFAVGDRLKEGAADLIARLKSYGWNTVLLSGDHKTAVDHAARTLGIDEAIAEVLPEDKLRIVTERQAAGHSVAMAGDGINDAPALAAADLGIAIGSGTDVAKEAADITVLGHQAGAIADGVELGQRTLGTIRGNLFWAFCYNIAAIPIAAGLFYPSFGLLLSPVIGAAAMAFSSVFVVTNSLRLRRFQPSR